LRVERVGIPSAIAFLSRNRIDGHLCGGSTPQILPKVKQSRPYRHATPDQNPHVFEMVEVNEVVDNIRRNWKLGLPPGSQRNVIQRQVVRQEVDRDNQRFSQTQNVPLIRSSFRRPNMTF
jgi:hypothetical protein